MDTIKNLREKYQEYFVGMVLNAFCLLVFWGGMLRKSFNADTIFHMVVEDADVLCNIEDGRYVIAFFDYILFKAGFRVTDNQSVTMLVTFILFSLTMLVLQHIFKFWMPDKDLEKAGYLIGLNLVFLNVLFSELLMFGEYCVYYGLGYLIAAIAVNCFIRKKYVFSVLSLAVAVSVYQFTVIFAAILLAFYLCLMYDEKLSWKAVVHEMVGIALCMGMGVLNLLSIKLIEKLGIITEFRKNAGQGDFEEKIKAAMASLTELYRSGGGILPDLWIPLLFALAVVGIIVYSCIENHQTHKILYVLLVYFGSILLIYVIPMMQAEFSMPPRMSFCFYLIQGLLVVTAYKLCHIQMKRLLTLGCIGYITIQLLFSNFVVTNHFVSNTLDEVYVNMFYREVLKYEKETGNTVNKILYGKDAYAPDHYEEVNYAVYQINERALGQATSSLVQVVTGRYFDFAHMTDEEFERYFSNYQGKDWNCFDLSEQLVIEGDTAYWCIY